MIVIIYFGTVFGIYLISDSEKDSDFTEENTNWTIRDYKRNTDTFGLLEMHRFKYMRAYINMNTLIIPKFKEDKIIELCEIFTVESFRKMAELSYIFPRIGIKVDFIDICRLLGLIGYF